jgi:hypothetical protein
MRVYTLGLACAALAAAAPVPSQTTFYKDALPVLEKNCQNCHRPGEAGPMSFMSYESTRPWAKAIKSAVASKKMPPWFADPHYGKFANDRSLSSDDVNVLVAWVDGGAKAGNPKDAPAPVAFAEGWAIGKPDKVFEIPTPVQVPASGVIDYQYVVMHTGFTEDKYVQFAEARPTDRIHTHHIIAFIREPGNPWFKDAPIGVAFVPKDLPQAEKGKGGEGGGGGFGGDFLAGYAPGTVPDSLKPGQAKLIPAGSDIVFQLHYTADGKTGEDRSRVGVIFSKVQPTERVLTLAAVNPRFTIPPGDSNYQVDSKITLQADSTLEMMLPHMHLRGKDFDFRVTYPDGKTETILSVPHYSFSWQLSYYLAKPLFLPKGSTIECTAHYDNSPNNPANPDPTKEVHYGEQSWDEMMFGFFDVAVPLNVTAMDLMRPPQQKHSTGAIE